MFDPNPHLTLFSRSWRLALCGIPWILLVAIALQIADGAESDRHSRFLDGLWRRQLYRQADLYCETQLRRSGLEEHERVELYVQLFKSYTKHTMNASGEQRTELWSRIAEHWEAFRQQQADVEAGHVVEFQYWLAELARGRILKLESELTAQPADSDLAIAALRDAIRGLTQLEQSVDESQRDTDSGSRSQTLNLQELHHQIQLKIAEASLDQARCYATGSADAIRLLSLARDRYASLARLAGDSRFTWESRIGLIRSQRLLGNVDAARSAIEVLSKVNELPDITRQKLEIERAKLAILAGEPSTGVQRLIDILNSPDPIADPHVEADAELTLVGACIALANEASRASEAEKAKHWKSQAVARVQKMEQSMPPYWVRRAELLLSSVRAGASDLTDIEVLARSAASQYGRKQFTDAIRTFNEAATLARDLGESSRAFELDYQAAAIRYQVNDVQGAGDAFRELALGTPRHINASDTHLMAITCAARLARETKGDLEAYESLLQEHVRKWSQGPSVDKARLWLAKLHQQRSDWSSAINSLTRISDASPRRDEVHQRIRESYLQLLRDEEMPEQDRSTSADEAAKYFLRFAEEQRQRTEGWDPPSREALLSAATFRWLFTMESVDELRSQLESAIASAPSDEPWASRARCLLVVAHVLSSDFDAARDQLSMVDWPQVDVGTDAVARLDQEMKARVVDATGTANFIQQLCEQLGASGKIGEVEKDRLSRFRADALGRMQRWREAIEIYKELAEQQPSDPTLHMRLGEMLEQDPATERQRAAMDRWRRVVRLSDSASPHWFQAKLAIARIHLRLGDPKRAAEVIRLTQVLHPDLGGIELQRRFADLLEQCEARE